MIFFYVISFSLSLAQDVESSHLDWEDVFAAGSYNGWICLSEISIAYKEFQTRYGVLMGELARRMDTLGISPQELFAAAKKSQTPAYMGVPGALGRSS